MRLHWLENGLLMDINCIFGKKISESSTVKFNNFIPRESFQTFFSEMADIRQFIRSELSIIKKEVIESTRSMIRNEIRSISFDSNL